jgi:polyisoprenoid-binding protein YceI
MNRWTLLGRLLIPLMLLLNFAAAPVRADDDDLCEAFNDGQVDRSILATMVNAAERGYLYRIQASTSRVGFCVESSLKRVEGEFTDFQGGMALDQPGSHDGQVLVAVKSASLKTGDQLIGRLIKSSQFFDVKNYPDILFVSKGFEWISSKSALMTGDLTLHGITRPVTFTVELRDEGGKDSNAVLVKASTLLQRSNFGMDAMSSLVSDTVQLCMTVRAHRYRANGV